MHHDEALLYKLKFSCWSNKNWTNSTKLLHLQILVTLNKILLNFEVNHPSQFYFCFYFVLLWSTESGGDRYSNRPQRWRYSTCRRKVDFSTKCRRCHSTDLSSLDLSRRSKSIIKGVTIKFFVLHLCTVIWMRDSVSVVPKWRHISKKGVGQRLCYVNEQDVVQWKPVIVITDKHLVSHWKFVIIGSTKDYWIKVTRHHLFKLSL